MDCKRLAMWSGLGAINPKTQLAGVFFNTRQPFQKQISCQGSIKLQEKILKLTFCGHVGDCITLK